MTAASETTLNTAAGRLRLEAGCLRAPAPARPSDNGGAAPLGARFAARFVRAGVPCAADGSPAGFEITAQALEAACLAGLFDGRAVFLDHAGEQQGPSLRRLVGATAASAWNTAEQAVDGEILLYASSPLAVQTAALLRELLQQGEAAPEVGLSIVFYPVWEARSPSQAGGAGRRIAAIRRVESVDLVFQPAAGGRILQALSAEAVHSGAQNGAPLQVDQPEFSNQPTKGESMSELTPNPSPAESAPAPAEQAQAWTAAAAEAGKAAILAAAGLPRAARQRLAGQDFPSPEALQAAVEAERAYLATLAEDGVIAAGGPPPRSPHISGVRTALDRLQLAVEAMIAGARPPDGIAPLTGVRELYHHLSGDYEMTGVFQPERIQLANVTSTTMAAMVANALNKAVVNEFAQYPQWWRPISTEMDFASLQAVKWITLGGIGELPTVAEGAAYTELTWDDKYETASFTKKGGYLGITLEAIDKDDTGRLRAAPRALAQSAWLTLSKAISAIFTSNSGAGPVMAETGRALFNTTDGNLGTAALSWSSYTAARTAMRKQTELNSGERLGALTAPRYLLVPPDLEITALQILASEGQPGTANNDANPLAEGADFNARMAAARARVIVVDLWTDANDWAACADPRLYPTLGVGYRYGRQPEVFSVASPTAGLMFTNDTMPIKVRFFFAVGPMDFRGLYKANVS